MIDSFGIHPAAARLGASSHKVLCQELFRRLARWMPPFMFLPVFAGIAAMMLCRTSVFWTLDALGLALSLATIGITVGVNVPLNRRLAAWPADAMPQDWEGYIWSLESGPFRTNHNCRCCFPLRHSRAELNRQ